LLEGDTIVAAVQEERLTGLKRARIRRLDESLALNYCLDAAGIGVDDLDVIVGAYFSGDPQTGLGITRQGWPGQYFSIPHHLAHAVGVFAQSGFEDATVLVIDGQGGLAEYLPESERVNIRQAVAPKIERNAEIISIYRADESGVHCLEKHLGEWMPNMARLRRGDPMQTFGSIGGMYSAVAHQVFGDAMDAGKVMGLAAFGERRFATDEFFTIADDGHFEFSDKIPRQFAGVGRWPDDKSENQDLATSVQYALEDAIHHLVARSRMLGESDRLCYAGGVALNAITNEQIIQKRYFDGAAYYGLQQLGKTRRGPRVRVDSVGRKYAEQRVDEAIAATPCMEPVDVDDPMDAVAELLDDGKIIGWFGGGSEIGPRALGQRSILSDPRSADAKTRLNARVKHREAFRPFAPLVIEEEAGSWFVLPDVAPTSELMLRTFPFLEEAKQRVPAVVHEDGSGRLQTLSKEANPLLYDLLQRFFVRTGVPIIVNTSFNVMGEPIVETPEDALWSLLHTDLDYVFLENRLVRRSSEFSSILDLHPVVAVVGVKIESPVQSGRFEVNLAPDSVIRVDVETEWGRHSPLLPQVALPILQLADGSRSARQILEAVQPTTSLDEKMFVGILRHLRRAQVLRFS
jgi:carbamoyltransferase